MSPTWSALSCEDRVALRITLAARLHSGHALHISLLISSLQSPQSGYHSEQRKRLGGDKQCVPAGAVSKWQSEGSQQPHMRTAHSLLLSAVPGSSGGLRKNEVKAEGV